jgi:hypothetical protein
MSDATAIARRTEWIVIALVVMRLIFAAVTPLTFDEAYYWTWSKHLAGGYYDHPPMVAVVIRLGTLMFGDTAFGVRIVSILLALPMTFAVYRAAEMLFHDARIAASGALLLNATLMVAAGTIIVTPDAPLMVTSAFVLYALAKVYDTGRGVWWLGVGAAVGLALLSKYTAMFFGASILLWLVIAKDMRRWLISPWPYLGGIVALALFMPVILWNADHHWVSFIKQLGRARVDGLTLKYFGELIPTQFAFATPLVFLLGVAGLYLLGRRGEGTPSARVLINVSFWVIVVYFCIHSLHSRVEANWLGPVYPAFAIAAAVAAHHTGWNAFNQRAINFYRRWALPSGVVLLLLLIVQANSGIFTLYKRDATVRSVGVGWPELARQIDAIAKANHATCIMAPDYGTTSWLMFYLPPGACVVQQGQRIRWLNTPEPDRAALDTILFVDEPREATREPLRKIYRRVEKVATLPRKRSGVAVETYELDIFQAATADPLDRAPPPELSPSR